MASPKTIFIVAGGTGGHVFPAKRVAQKFIEEGFKIIWIGTSRGPEKNICKDLGISFIQVPLYGFRGKSFFSKFKVGASGAVGCSRQFCKDLLNLRGACFE